tara:strand:- start:95 stop:508 length:414 start_codon:yes stop_codon:yes gene_type:complete
MNKNSMELYPLVQKLETVEVIIMTIRALSPQNKKELVRFPPSNYKFDENKHYQGEDEYGYLGDGLIIKSLYPELQSWKNKSCVFAWFAFGEHSSWTATDVTNERHEYFLPFLYAYQELETDHDDLDCLDEEWKAVGK